MKNKMEQKHVVVVGGSSGFGLATATELKRQGARLTLVGRRVDPLLPLAGKLGAKAIVGDLTEPGLEWAAGIDGPVDHLFIAAGAFVGGGLLETDPEGLRPAVEARLWGPVKLIRKIEGRLAPEASVVLTGGVSTRRPNRGAWVTNVATALADQLARVLAVELAPRRVNAVAPGFALTPMWDGLSEGEREGYATFFRERTPTGRLATAEDVAEAVIALMANPAINGQTIYVDGGYSAA
jgi:NAD(P)-dependent dehydrogenase (short-subunit alcohol dehydrogenase family)